MQTTLENITIITAILIAVIFYIGMTYIFYTSFKDRSMHLDEKVSIGTLAGSICLTGIIFTALILSHVKMFN